MQWPMWLAAAVRESTLLLVTIPAVAGVRIPEVARPIEIVEVEGPLMTKVEKSNLEKNKHFVVVCFSMIYQRRSENVACRWLNQSN